MAGLGFKDFQVGEVLTSSDVDGYLMQQTVMRFADSGARGSALGTAAGTGVALAEGMVSYLDDSNRVEFYDGTVWRPTGSILQVVSTTKTDTYSFNGSGFDSGVVTGLTATITPSLSSSKILVMVNLYGSGSGSNDARMGYVMMRDSTEIAKGDAASSRTSMSARVDINSSGLPAIGNASAWHLDSPATTSALVYGIKLWNSGSYTQYVNRTVLDTDSSGIPRTASTITVMEVAA